MTTVDEILTERGNRYGVFTRHAMITQALKEVMMGSRPMQFPKVDAEFARKFDNLAPDQKESLEMIAHKIGRILNGDPDYADSWQDIAGYAQLVADRLNGKVR
jgi:hypothetical protein